jgi:alcohol dehydrogenase class IV
MTFPVPSNPESVFTYGAPQLKFGAGASAEIGFDLAQYRVKRALVVTDHGVAATGTPERIAGQIGAFGIDAVIFDGAHVEPTDTSMAQAVDWARVNGPFDGFVGVGGGSSIDTAKVMNLLTTNDGELMDYVNPPVGGGKAPTNALRPLVAVPTTTGTGSESTTVCVLDILSLKVKTGVSHPRLRPTLAVVDPELALSQPAGVTASAGMDIVCHALESYTARPYGTFEHKTPEQRVPYCGSNPIADMYCEQALTLMAGAFRRAVTHGEDRQARSAMALAATYAGMGIGSAGLHIPHANAYPIAGHVRDFHPKDYPADEPMVPHGMSVSLTAPDAFRFTFEATPDRHVHAAQLLGPKSEQPNDTRQWLPQVLSELMRDIEIPNGIAAVGYQSGDIPDLVEGTMAQQRLLVLSPKPVTEDNLSGIYERSMELW